MANYRNFRTFARPRLTYLEDRCTPAVILSDNIDNSTAGIEAATGNRWITSSFATDASAHTLTSITLKLANPVAGSATLGVYTDNGLQPGALVGNLVAPPSYSTGLSNTTFVGNNLNLAANTTYWIVLKATTGEFDWAWTAINTGTGVGFQHTYGETDDAGATWFTLDTYPTQYTVTTDAGSIAFSSAATSINEAAGTATVSLTRTGGTSGAVAVTLAATGGSATSGSDYSGLPVTVNFADGQATATATITINNDTDVEPSETIALTLSNATGGAVLGTLTTSTVTIVDNDVAAPAKITGITINNAAVQRSRVTSIAVTFDQVVSFIGAAAFQLVRQSDSQSVTLVATPNVTNTVVTLTFTGGAVEGMSGNYSLADGFYTLTVLAGQFAGSGLDGNGDGTAGDNYTLLGTLANSFYRLFGDSDGDGDVDNADFTNFRSALGTGATIFDADGDGDTDNADFTSFRSRFGTTLP